MFFLVVISTGLRIVIVLGEDSRVRTKKSKRVTRTEESVLFVSIWLLPSVPRICTQCQPRDLLILVLFLTTMDDDDYPRLPRRNRGEDDPKMIGLWKVGRTIGKGSSGIYLGCYKRMRFH